MGVGDISIANATPISRIKRDLEYAAIESQVRMKVAERQAKKNERHGITQ